MPNAQFESVRKWDISGRQDILTMLGRWEAGKFDLIHMQDWTECATSLPILPQELYR